MLYNCRSLSDNASRSCLQNGTWDYQTDYTQCMEHPLIEDIETDGSAEYYEEISMIIYYTGKCSLYQCQSDIIEMRLVLVLSLPIKMDQIKGI